MAELDSIGDDVKRRLRQTEMENNEGAAEAGVKAGREWAKPLGRAAPAPHCPERT